MHATWRQQLNKVIAAYEPMGVLVRQLRVLLEVSRRTCILCATIVAAELACACARKRVHAWSACVRVCARVCVRVCVCVCPYVEGGRWGKGNGE